MSGILVISPERWDDHNVSKHHYARTLARRGHDVLFLNPPVQGQKSTSIADVPCDGGRIRVVTGRALAPGLRFMPRAARNRIESRWLEKLERQAGTKISVIWLFENSRFFDMRFAGDRLKIYHQVDLNQDFNLKSAAMTADICFGTTDYIVDALSEYCPRTHKIGHGLFLPENPGKLGKEHKDMLSAGRLNAAYVGNIEIAYIDRKLLCNVVNRNSNVTFHFIGGYDPDGYLYRQLHMSENVRWWGKIPSDQIIPALQEMDIYMVCYQAERFRDQLSSPHKMLEYLYGGKATVATYTDEYKDKRELLEMVDEPSRFLDRFAEVAANPECYNSPEKMKMRRDFALDHTYARQLDRIIAHLDNAGLAHELNRKSRS